MKFVENGPDIPLSILRAQREGNLMFVVGAGVSRAARLPLFGQLVDQVYEALGQELPGNPASLATKAEEEARNDGQYDRLIGLLEHRLVDRGVGWRQPTNPVREKVGELLQPRRGASQALHYDLLNLSRAGDGRPRIVTTNFDTLFERVWLRKTGRPIVSSATASLPPVGSYDFTGVLHLHGRIEDRKLRLAGTDLVLSAPNFGEAYMRSGWASRTVYDLLRRYTLILVGYSADDPPMRYMLEATEEGRLSFPDLKPAYALVGDGEGDSGGLREKWRAKGVEPLLFSALNNDFSGLYTSLREWANMVTDPLSWAEQQLSSIASRPLEGASENDREKFGYLANEISSPLVAAGAARDPSWIETIEKEAEHRNDWVYYAWFREKLEDPRAAQYAASVSDHAKKGQIAAAVDQLLRFRSDPIAEPYETFWTLFIQAYKLGASKDRRPFRASQRITITRVRDTVARFAPSLQIDKHFYFDDQDGSVEQPESIHQLARFHFKALDREWKRALDKWPSDGDAEERLILALDRSFAEALELANDAGLLDAGGDLGSFDLALVHAPEEHEGLVEPDEYHGRAWSLNQPDSYNDRFAPTVRLMTGLWRRLAEHDASKATRIAADWASREPVIFKRLASWAASISDIGPVEAVIEYLQTTTRDRYWACDKSPEIVRFYCQRWNKLPDRVRMRLESAILAGYRMEDLRQFARKGSVRYAKALYTVRELVRVQSAGGRLSQKTRLRLKALQKSHPGLPTEMPLLAHLYSPSWSGWGSSADVGALEDVDEEHLISAAEALEADHRRDQGDIWAVLSRQEPARVFRALVTEGKSGAFPAQRWNAFLGNYAYREEAERIDELPRLAEVLDVIDQVPHLELLPIVHPLSRIVERWSKATGDPLFPKILELWQKALLACIAYEASEERVRSLPDAVPGSPLAALAEALVTMQANVQRRKGRGFDERFAPLFAQLTSIKGWPGLVAKAALMRQLVFLNWLSPTWAEHHLFDALGEETDQAIDLMSIVAFSSAARHPTMLNRLKQPIIRALEHERTEDWARENLSGAIVGAALSIIEGRKGYQLTAVECRRTFTRMPNSVLSRMAAELSSLLRGRTNAQRARYWRNVISPFLAYYWPNDVSVRTEDVSENLIGLPCLAGAAFPEAVEQVLGIIRPMSVGDIRYGFGFDEAESQMKRHPKSALRLIAGATRSDASRPTDIDEIVQAFLEADPEIVNEPDFWRIRQMQQPR